MQTYRQMENRETEKNGKTNIQTNGKHTYRQTELINRSTKNRLSSRRTNGQQTDRQTDSQADRQTDRQTDGHALASDLNP